ncbi:MAG TPA: hypothetical protein VFH03_24675 [Actinoplanes sp.]|nr:hypothetical protein [Actinoplanes sp.]
MTGGWTAFPGAQVAALTRSAEPGERDCPGCGGRSLRTYLTPAPQAKRPTLITYVWCPGCRRFAGSRAKHPPGVIVADPLAALSAADRRALESSVAGFLAHLDRLWDSGVLPQTFAAA